MIFVGLLVHYGGTTITPPESTEVHSIETKVESMSETSVSISESKIEESKSEEKVTKEEQETIDKLEEKKKILTAFSDLLKEVQKSPKKDMSLKDRFDNIAKDNKNLYEFIDSKVFDKIYLTDFMGEDYEGQAIVAMSLIGFVSGLETNFKNTDMSPKITDPNILNVNLYYDEISNTAHVPMDLFTGELGAVSFEMVKINGEWKLAPYTYIQSLQLANTVSNANNKQEKTGE